METGLLRTIPYIQVREMWSIGLSLLALLLTYITHWIYKWRNPSCNGKLPPGSMGFPLIGETIQFIIPSKSLDIPPFIKKRMKRYGPMFRTSLAGRPVVISTDPDFNHFILQQEGKLVELWYLDSMAKFMGNADATNGTGYIHKYLRSLVLNHFGPECLKEKLIPELEDLVRQRLKIWSSLPSVDVKKSSLTMTFDYTSKLLFGYDSEKSSENLSENFTNFLQGFMSFPLNIPGTTFHRCLKIHQRATNLIKDAIQERRAKPENSKGDFLDQIIKDMNTETFMTESFIVHATFGILLASFETISSTLALAIKLLTEHSSVVKELMEEHEAILRNRENKDSKITWNEYKSMSFTQNVINESLRLASVAPGILRRAIKDIQVNGYTIPAGWAIMVVPSALQLNPNTFKDPLTFNPWRWKELKSNVIAKNFIPFGGGMRQCAGAEFSKVFMAIFLHIFLTKYRWIKIKGGDVTRTPALGFGNGFHIKVLEKGK